MLLRKQKKAKNKLKENVRPPGLTRKGKDEDYN